jgi:ribonucleoside-triphosphate reductase
MFTHIRKRNGEIATFEFDKLADSIVQAGQSSGEVDLERARHIAEEAVDRLLGGARAKTVSTEEVYAAVAMTLQEKQCYATASAYYQHGKGELKRQKVVRKKQVDLVEQYLSNKDWQVCENSNTGYSLQGLNNYVTSELIKNYWQTKIYPTEIGDASRSGDFHIHDLSSLSTYCVGWDLQDLLMVGFQGAYGKIESKPAKHFRTVLGQLVNFFYTLQGESAGAQAISSFDTLLAPFIRYDNLSFGEVKQALQEFMFNMNVPTRVGFQCPFTNVTLDLQPHKTLADQHVIIGGQAQAETYGQFQAEMDIFNKAFTAVLLEGDAKGRVFTFPIPTYNITADFDWNNPMLENVWKMTAKYGIPYFSNFINSDMKPEDARSMCCRLRLDNRELRKRGGGLFGANPLTGSVGVVTINMPRLGYLAKDEADFYDRLGRIMDLAKQSLEIKRATIERFTDQGLYPYSRFYLRNIKERFGKYWTNHFSTIGLVGMNEAVLNLLKCPITTPEGQFFANQVLEFMRNRIQEYQTETGNYYNLEATPAESTGYRLALKDKKLYPNCLVANEEQYKTTGQAPFYTNSSHVPVDYTKDIFELLDLQDDLQTKYTGGTVVHIFLGEELSNLEAVKALIRTICTKYRLPYFTLTPTFSVCPVHGYIAGAVPRCSTCGAENNVYSRVVGYLRPVKQWNEGKKAEFEHRNTYDDALNVHDDVSQGQKTSGGDCVRHVGELTKENSI